MSPIVVMATRGQPSYLLINHLAERFDIAQVIFEAPRQGKMLRYRLRRLGPVAVAGQMAFLGYDRLVIRPRSRARIAALLDGHDVRPPDGRLDVLDVDSVNTDQVADLLDDLRPGAVVVSGTGIIARRILERAPAFVNIHVGITPRYRGVHGGFWAVYEGRPDLVGTTIHLLDPGVDTGEIIEQRRVDVDPFTDTYRTLPVKQYLGALEAMADAVRAVLDGRARPYRRTDLESRQWYSPTPLEYRYFQREMRRLRRAGRQPAAR
ncbi:formyl transferase [Nonomuraea roseoviolacea]|uniref:phosphoribosylglycinamide formyltransferase 1 n=1 Tax=Nonomuraea roseoviolacea subsp. carminata TaxID=160689 RepID=A0ABT1K593_9ACTN|nr:formyl transferase [Nonomuraea roseoviolacea]MCP2349168.1 methionyl-tRNA formyltransferase [Nonomuraea roseoviolacea subsp. carminata]